ncbi:MAG TPA: hypothetical protein VGK67_18840 [Myxococcales bacterium]|jgi:cysteine-rich repeat protein
MRSRLHLFLAAACLLAATGCPKTDPTPEKTCSADSDCKAGEERCLGEKCLPVRCGDHPCHANEGCVDGQCRAADCLEVTCAATEGCAFGKCLPLSCTGTACAAGEVCVKDQCVWTGCAEKACAVGAICVNGLCKGKACGETACGEGAACVDGKCVAPSCVGIQCKETEACAQGRCLPLSCGETACPTGQACVDGRCGDPGCAGLTCSTGFHCSAGACLACPAHETACGDGSDDDCDGQTDCADSDCEAQDCAAGKACKAGTCADEPCGNGKIDGTEECDDQNRVGGDGCSRACVKECGWACDGKPSTCTPEDFFDVSAKVAAAAGTSALKALALADDGLYVGGEGGKLFHFDRACNVTDLSPKLSGFWGDATILSMAWDPGSKVLYLGGAKQGRFAVLHPKGWLGTDPKHPGADQAFDLSAKHALTTAPWSVDAMVFDPTGKAVYLAVNDTTACGPSHLVRYRPDADACDVGLNSCPNPCVAPPNACEVRALVLDDAGRTLWATGRGKPWTGIHKFGVDTGTFTKCASASLGNNLPRALVWDAAGKGLYVTGTIWDSPGGEFVRWEPESATTTKLSSKLEGMWGQNSSDLNDLWALAVDPEHRAVYVGGRLAKMARYRTPDAGDQPDTATLVPLTSTSWLPPGTPATDAAAVRALAYDPAGFIWIAGENGRLARKVAR